MIPNYFSSTTNNKHIFSSESILSKKTLLSTSISGNVRQLLLPFESKSRQLASKM
jgi:hypothetical protein